MVGTPTLLHLDLVQIFSGVVRRGTLGRQKLFTELGLTAPTVQLVPAAASSQDSLLGYTYLNVRANNKWE